MFRLNEIMKENIIAETMDIFYYIFYDIFFRNYSKIKFKNTKILLCSTYVQKLK